MNSNKKLIITEDGSHTIYDTSLNEIFHSRFGAIAESQHIYIRNGFDFVKSHLEQITILEVGFGTGLNAWLTFIESSANHKNVEYHAIEPYPLPETIYQQLNYAKFSEDHKKEFMLMHKLLWDSQSNLSNYFQLHKINRTIEEIDLPENKFNLVYFDAFSPDVHPAIWSEKIFYKIYQSMKSGGTLVTYSTRGTVKRNLIHAGFVIEKFPGSKGKRENLRAIKN